MTNSQTSVDVETPHPGAAVLSSPETKSKKSSRCGTPKAATQAIIDMLSQDPNLAKDVARQQFLKRGCDDKGFEPAYQGAKGKFVLAAYQEGNMGHEAAEKKLLALGIPPENVKAELDKKAPATNTDSTDRGHKTSTQKNAEEAQRYADRLMTHVEKKQGTYLQDDAGGFSVLLNGKRISLNFVPENHLLNGLLLKICNITLHDYIAHSVVERLIQVAFEAAGKFELRTFSAMFEDRNRLYISLKDSSKLLRISAEDIAVVQNGKNEDNLWLEHPAGDISSGSALDYKEDDPAEGLQEFERLVVNSMAVREPGMEWFLAMEETPYPFVRELNNDRFIPQHGGRQGGGKTTAAELSAYTLGLKATGDTTAPSLNRLGDCGLLIMDNKESANFSVGFNGYIIYLATGAPVAGKKYSFVMQNAREPSDMFSHQKEHTEPSLP